MNKVQRTSTGVTLEKELELHEAVITNETETVRKILSKSELLNVDCRNNYGRAPIHLAASRGNTDIIEMLINAGCDIEATDKFGMRPLHMAAWYGQEEAVHVLVNAGALLSAVDKRQRNLLMMASRSNGTPSFLEYVTRKLEPEAQARDCEGASALHHAARAGNVRAIDLLARSLPNLDYNSRDQKGQTALHYACAEGRQEAAARLLELGASLNVQDAEGCTALHLAANNRDSRLCNWLLGRCSSSEIATLLRLADHRGFILLHVAASLGCGLILRYLLQLDPRREEALETLCRRGDTPLHLAVLNNQHQIIDVLLEHGAPLSALNREMQTPLQLATALGHNQVCRLLAAVELGKIDEAVGKSKNDNEKQETSELEEKGALHLAAKSSLASIANMIARTARLDYPALVIQSTRALFNSPDD